MTPRICYSQRITRRNCEPCSVEQLKEMMNDPQVQAICDQIKLLDGRDPEELARLKRQLPIITPHAQRFEHDRRRADEAIPSGLVMLDIDHIDDPRQRWEDIQEYLTLPTEGDRPMVIFAAVTPSGHGLRIIAERRLADLAADQAQLARDLGIANYDSCTKDLSRASFVMPMSYVLYMDESGLAFATDEAAEAAAEGNYELRMTTARGLSGGMSGGGQPSMAVRAKEGGESGGMSGGEMPMTYKEVEYGVIMEHLVGLLGGEPEYGERNTFYFTMVRYARYICDFNQDLLLAVLPSFGLSESERRSVVSSAVNRPRKSETPELVLRALALAQAAQQSGGTGNGAVEIADSPSSSLPAQMPKVLDVICRHLPESFRPAMVIAALPILGALATKVRFRYLDHALHSFSFMSCITAPAATGKSFIRTPVNMLLTPIDEQDDIERQKEQEYKDALKAAKNSKNQPENPRACPRNNGINISVAKLLQLLTYSEGKHLIGIGEEIDTLVKTERAGVWSQKSDIYRLGFDNARYGQCYMNDNSFSANVEVFYNLLLTGTPGGMYRFFKDVEDGLVTRFCFAQLPDMFGSEMPAFTAYSEAEEQEVIRYARYLDQADCSLSCPAVDEAIRGWLEEKRQLAIKSDSRAIDTLRRRAAVIGFRAGYLAGLLERCGGLSGGMEAHPCASAGHPYGEGGLSGGGQPSMAVRAKEEGDGSKRGVSGGMSGSADFALWVAEYVFQNQMQLFGTQFEKVADEYQASVSTRGKVRKLLQSLPESFTKSDLITLRIRNGQTSDIGYVLTRWKQNGLIEEVGNNTYRKV